MASCPYCDEDLSSDDLEDIVARTTLPTDVLMESIERLDEDGMRELVGLMLDHPTLRDLMTP